MTYLANKDAFMEYSYLALQNLFASRNEFNSFFDAIKSDKQKNLFLKTASFYLFLVKHGDWIYDIQGVIDKRTDYLTDTYKYIAIFSLIESLNSKRFMDFYDYLIRSESDIKFPIENKAELGRHYQKYKSAFGSIQQYIRFFNSLSEQKKKTLKQKLEIENTEQSIENLSKYLYELRSQFVHEAELIANISGRTTLSRRGKNIVINKLSIADLMQFFEEGLVQHFRTEKT